MLASLVACLACALSLSPASDTLRLPVQQTPWARDSLSGRSAPSTLRIPTSAGEVEVWVERSPAWIRLFAVLPDTSFYWGDDLVISLDPDGSGGTAPGAGDRQWYVRRVPDSSRVFVSTGGRWMTPGVEPQPLGPVRVAPEWELAVQSSPTQWTVELRIRVGDFATSSAALPRLALRSYNDQPRGWWSWPLPPADVRAQRVEHSPDLWVPVVLP